MKIRRAIHLISALQVRPWLWVTGLVCLPFLLTSLYQDYQRHAEASNPQREVYKLIGNLDTLSGDIRQGSMVRVAGWAANTRPDAVVQRVDIFINNNVIQTAQLGFQRHDVVNIMKRNDFLNSGWEATFTLPSLPSGIYNITAFAFDSSNVPTPLGGGKIIRIE